MIILIKGPTADTRIANKLVIEAYYMHGDADGDSTETRQFDYLPGQPAPAHFETIIQWLRHLESVDDYDTTHEFSGLKKLAREFFNGDEEKIRLVRDEFQPADMFSDGDMPAHLEGFSVFWYNADGQKNDVELKD